MAYVGINLDGDWAVHLQDGSTSPKAAKIERGAEPGTVVITNENGDTSDGEFISPSLIWTPGYGHYAFVIDAGNTLMWRHTNICWLRQ